MLRPYAQTRISASFVVMLLVVSTGLLFGFWDAGLRTLATDPGLE
jgi:two-component system cell cycle sensor histidine kinase PleC